MDTIVIYMEKLLGRNAGDGEDIEKFINKFKNRYVFISHRRKKRPWQKIGNKTTIQSTYRQSGVWLDKSKKCWIMASGPGSPFGLEDKTPWTSWMFNFGGLSTSPQTRNLRFGHNILLSFLCGSINVLLFFFSRKFWGKGRFVQKTWNQEKSWKITRLRQ